MAEKPVIPDMHDPPPPEPRPADDAASEGVPEWRIKLAFGAMLAAGVITPLLANLLSGGGEIAAVVIPSIVFFALIGILWPSWQTPLFAVMIVYWLEFIVGGLLGGSPAVIGLLLTRKQPALLAIPASAMIVCWLAAGLSRLYVKHRRKITGE